MKHWPVTRTSFIAVVVPVMSLLLGVLVRHERPGTLALAGSALILGAVVAGIAGDAHARG
jgi:drug/metabolite transporter (DMT)-like permease